MTFSREEIVEEFAQAAMLGGYWTHEAQIERWESRRLRRSEQVRLPPMPARRNYALEDIPTLPIELVACPRCGRSCERRAGMKQLVHINPNRCRK